MGDLRCILSVSTLRSLSVPLIFRHPVVSGLRRSCLIRCRVISVCSLWMMERDGEVIGYCGMWVLFEEAHITNIAIHPDYRGQGSGKELLLAAMEHAASFGAEMMTLEVRETNLVAQNMYAKFDFLQQGFRKKYYSDTGEGALLLWNRNILETIENNACLKETYLLQSKPL